MLVKNEYKPRIIPKELQELYRRKRKMDYEYAKGNPDVTIEHCNKINNIIKEWRNNNDQRTM